MTVDEMRIQAQLKFPRKINLQFAIRYINDAIKKLCKKYDTAGIRETITITAKADEWYDIDPLFFKVKECIINGTKTKTNAFRIRSKKVQFDYDGTYDFTYIRYPKDVTGGTEEPEIAVDYHDILPDYIASKERARIFGMRDEDAQILLAEFYDSAKDTHTTLKSHKGTSKRIKAPIW